jgi:hypothetical protein
MSITDVIVRGGGGGGGGGGGEHCRSPCNGYMSIEAWEPKSPEFSIFTASRKEPSVARRGGSRIQHRAYVSTYANNKEAKKC